MSKPVVIPNAFAAQSGPIPLSQLDADFTAAANALNDLATYANYFADSSGAANQLTVTVPLPLTVAYVTGLALQIKIANTNTATAVNINVNGLGNKAVVLNDGTAPPIGSLTANSILDLMYDGTSFRVLGMRASTIITTGLFGDGTAGAPSISFASDPDTGFYHLSANRIGFSSGGVVTAALDNRFTMGTGVPILADDGLVGAPAISFVSDPDTGIYHVAANVGGFSAGGVSVLAWDANPSILIPDGTSAVPGVRFLSDGDTGMYHVSPNVMGFSAGGTTIFDITATAFEVAGCNAFTFGTLNSGAFTLNVVTAATATAGGGALPATPRGFWTVTINGTTRKIPYYDN